MKLKEPEVIYKSGKPTAVILPLAEYQEMLERVEDAADLQWLKKMRRRALPTVLFPIILNNKRRVPTRH